MAAFPIPSTSAPGITIKLGEKPPYDAIYVHKLIEVSELGVDMKYVAEHGRICMSRKYTCIRQHEFTYQAGHHGHDDGTNSNVVSIVGPEDDPPTIVTRPINSDFACMSPDSLLLAYSNGLTVEVYDVQRSIKVKDCQVKFPVMFMTWLNDDCVAIVTQKLVYNWAFREKKGLVQMFELLPVLTSCKITSYISNGAGAFLAVCGTLEKAGGWISGYVQLYSTTKKVSQQIEAHAVTFCDIFINGALTPCTLLVFVHKLAVQCQLFIQELAQGLGATPFARVVTKIPLPDEFNDDYPLFVRVSEQSHEVYLVTRLSRLYIFELETGRRLFQGQITHHSSLQSGPMLLNDGVLVVNSKGHILSVTTSADRGHRKTNEDIKPI